MRALIQRVTEATVTVDQEAVAAIGPGLVILLGIGVHDGEEEARYVSGKVANLRIFSDEAGKFKSSALDTRAELLIVSQFTLYGDTRKGRRPSFAEAAGTKQAESMFDRTVELFRETGLAVQTGRFQAYMQVSIHNDGPVTIILDSSNRGWPRRG